MTKDPRPKPTFGWTPEKPYVRAKPSSYHAPAAPSPGRTGRKPIPPKGQEGQYGVPPPAAPPDQPEQPEASPAEVALEAVAEIVSGGPQVLDRWYAVVEGGVSSQDARVILAGDEESIWAPIEVAVTQGQRVIVDFRLDGNLAVTAVIQ